MLVIFQWSLRNSKSPPVFRTPLSNLVMVWMVSILSLDSISTSFFQTVGDRSNLTKYKWYNYYPHVPQFFLFLVLWQDLSIFSLSFIFTLWSAETRCQILSFLQISTRSGLPVGIRWSVWISKSQKIYASHSLGWILVCAYII